MDESPRVEFQLFDKDTGAPEVADSLRVEVFDRAGRNLGLKPRIARENGKYLIEFEKGRQMRPGVYNLSITAEWGNQSLVQEQTISWGLVAVNTKRSLYHPGETAHLIVVVLDLNGFPVAGADVNVTITSPPGNLSTISTSSSLLPGTEKGIYEGDYLTSVEGTYNISVSAFADGVSSSIDTFFLAKAYYEFDILREQPTKIDPTRGPFNAQIKIVSFGPAGPFAVREYLPANFSISNVQLTDSGGKALSGPYATDILNDTLILTFSNVPDNSVISYTADAPKVWPVLFMAGPIEVDHSSGTFVEARPWMIAVDPTVTTYVVIGTANNTAGTELKILSCPTSGACTENTTLDSTIGEMGAAVYDLLVEDIDDDGMLEIVSLVAAASNQLRVSRCTASGCVNVTGEFSNTGLQPLPYGRGIAFGDVDNDGRKELVAGFDSGTNEIRIYNCTSTAVPSSLASGACTQRTAYDFSGTGAQAVSVGDIDNDGLEEILVTTSTAAYGGDYELSVLDCTTSACALNTTLSYDVGRRPGMVAYGESTVQTPRYRMWNGTDWSAELTANSVGGTIEWVLVASSPVRDEYLLGTADAGDDVNVQVYSDALGSPCWHNGTTCGSVLEVTAASTTVNMRKFGVAYEMVNGSAIVVYSDNTAAPKYRIWNGTGWTAQGTITVVRTTGIVENMKLVSRPNSDEIALVYSDANDDLNAMIWNGTAWGCEPAAALTTALYTADYQEFDAAYEQVSGDLFIAFGLGASLGVSYTQKPAGSCTYTTALQSTGFSEYGDMVSVGAQPGSNYIIVSEFSSTDSDMDAGVWNGTAWKTFPATQDIICYASDAVPDILTSAAWAGPGNRGIHVYSDAATNTNVDWYSYSKSGDAWVAETAWPPTPTNLADEDNVIRTYSFIEENKTFVFIKVDPASLQSLWAKIYDGNTNTWSSSEPGGTALEGDSSSLDFPSFDFTWQLYPPPVIYDGIITDSDKDGLQEAVVATAANSLSGWICGSTVGGAEVCILDCTAAGCTQGSGSKNTNVTTYSLYAGNFETNTPNEIKLATGSAPTANEFRTYNCTTTACAETPSAYDSGNVQNYWISSADVDADGNLEVLTAWPSTTNEFKALDCAGAVACTVGATYDTGALAVYAVEAGNITNPPVGLGAFVGGPASTQYLTKADPSDSVVFNCSVNLTKGVATSVDVELQYSAGSGWFDVNSTSFVATLNPTPVNFANQTKFTNFASWTVFGTAVGTYSLRCAANYSADAQNINDAQFNSSALSNIIEVGVGNLSLYVNTTPFSNLPKNSNTSFAATLTCNGGAKAFGCPGQVNISVRFNYTSANPDTLAPTADNTNATIVIGSNPYNCPSMIANGSVCFNNFTILGVHGSYSGKANWYDIRAVSNDTDVAANDTANSQITVYVGQLGIGLDQPTSDFIIGVDRTFLLNATATCSGLITNAPCSNVSVSGRYNETAVLDTLIQNTGTKLIREAPSPTTNPFTCNGLVSTNTCILRLIVNGTFPGNYLIDANYSTADSEVSSPTGNTVDRYVTVDGDGPSVNIQAPTNGKTYASTTVDLNYTVSDPSGVSQCKYERDGLPNVSLSNCGNDSLPGLGEGGHTVKVWANDSWDNWGVSNTVSFVVDTTPPAWVELPVNQTVYYSTSFVYDVNATDNFVIDKYWISDTSNFTINPATGLIENNTFLSVGTYPLTVSVNDTAGNFNSSTFYVRVIIMPCRNATLSYSIRNAPAGYHISFNLTSGSSTTICSAYLALFLPNNNTATPQSGSGFDLNGTYYSDSPAMNTSNATVSGGYVGFSYSWQFNFTGIQTTNLTLNITGYNDFRTSEVFTGVDPFPLAESNMPARAESLAARLEDVFEQIYYVLKNTAQKIFV